MLWSNDQPGLGIDIDETLAAKYPLPRAPAQRRLAAGPPAGRNGDPTVAGWCKVHTLPIVRKPWVPLNDPCGMRGDVPTDTHRRGRLTAVGWLPCPSPTLFSSFSSLSFSNRFGHTVEGSSVDGGSDRSADDATVPGRPFAKTHRGRQVMSSCKCPSVLKRDDGVVARSSAGSEERFHSDLAFPHRLCALLRRAVTAHLLRVIGVEGAVHAGTAPA